MDRFYEGLGIEVCGEIEIGVMDMWKAFERSFQAHCPNGKIAYDHFHISPAPGASHRCDQACRIQARRQ
ncbi:MAG: transposase [Fibrobacteres bacterium]|nr:transposase [Fibrobacterota bacterium]